MKTRKFPLIGGNKIKTLFSGTMFLALIFAVPIPMMAGVQVNIGIAPPPVVVALPPPIVFPAPPAVIVMHDTSDVYVDPDIDVDLFFRNGWWWRPWEGRWYRSRYYDRGWAYYNHVPRFYFDVHPGWRGYYSSHNWNGNQWNYQRIPYQQLHQNWKTWHNNRYWTKQGMGVQNYQPHSQQHSQQLRQQRQREYQQRPEVQMHQQHGQPQQRQQHGEQQHGEERR